MATNIDYPSYLPCARLSGNTHIPGDTFIRSQFDYGIRQRKKYCSQYGVGFTFIAKSQGQMKSFSHFYYTTLNDGVNSFLADWQIEGIDGTKEFRFSSVYNVTALGANKFSISASFDMITKMKDLSERSIIEYSMNEISTLPDGTRYLENEA